MISLPSASLQTLYLPVDIFRVRGVSFSHAQVKAMISRTNEKLEKISIKIEWDGVIHDVHNSSLANVTSANVTSLLKNGSSGRRVRVFLVKKEVEYGSETWTYDPVEDASETDVWQGAIFICDSWNRNSDAIYKSRGYMGSNDSLLHELGHVLMQKADHYSKNKSNFFHRYAHLSDDTITPHQATQMRKSRYLIRRLPKKISQSSL